MHWDAVDSLLVSKPFPTRALLAEGRRHLYDVVDVAGTDDPMAISDLYHNNPAEHGRGLTCIRYYYWQIGDLLNRGIFSFAVKVTRGPAAAMTLYQLFPMAMMAGVFAVLATDLLAMTRGRNTLVRCVGLSFLVAVATSPPFLSISRQLLTETIGVLFVVLTLRLTVAALVVPNAGRKLWTLAALAGMMAFFAVRARYTMLPTLGLLMPVVLLRAEASPLGWRSDARRWGAFFAVFGVAAFVLVAVDAAIFGPYLMPWVYREVMVRSAQLFFYRPTSTEFVTALFPHLPFLALSVIVVILVAVHPAPSSWRKLGRCAAIVALIGTGALLYQMSKVHTQYQPRHVVALSCGPAIAAGILVGFGRWGRFGGTLLMATCLALISANVYSTFYLQSQPAGETDADYGFGHELAKIDSQHRPLWSELPRAMVGSYYDWADRRRLHDVIAVYNDALRYSSNGKAVVFVNNNVLLIDYFDAMHPFYPDLRVARWFPDRREDMRREILRIRGMPKDVFVLDVPGSSSPDVGTPMRRYPRFVLDNAKAFRAP